MMSVDLFGNPIVESSDIVLTPEPVAAAVIQRFDPKGTVLDPCRGEGAFFNRIKGCKWCEVRQGKDFFEWDEQVDWIISNPPYSIFSTFLRHSFKVSENIVYLIPVNKIFNSFKMMREVWDWGGVPVCYVIGGGASLGFPIGFTIGAVHFRKGFKGGMKVEFMEDLNRGDQI